MQPAPSTRIPDGFMAAMRLEGEKPHQGLPGRNPALYQGPTVCNSTTALGLRGQAELNRVGSCSTGKERDSESGNDYFGARYYASSMGRFMSPDWNEYPDEVPYADFENPQSLNLYGYVNNNPLRSTDADGHTHQECAPDTMTTNANGDTVVHAGACHDVPDWWNLWTNYSNWRQKMANDWNKRIEDHRPPPQPPNQNLTVDDILNGGALLPGRFGWRGGTKWRDAVKELMKPGTHEKIAGEVPTREQATDMIENAGGKITRGGAGQPMDAGEQFGHEPGGVSDHTYPHINYETASGAKATVRVEH